MLLRVLGELASPTARARLRAARADAVAEVLAHFVGHEELLVLRPAVDLPWSSLISSAPSGAPWASCVLALFGAP